MIVPAPNVSIKDGLQRSGRTAADRESWPACKRVGAESLPGRIITIQALAQRRSSAASRWRSLTAMSRGVAP